ncbi:MAG: tetratricopeptide repeat protein [Oscillospiraceae bacterium]
MDIGKKIRMLRAGKSVTQEKLAQELNVTPQAVSKWENGSALPDITLLPALSVYFGVRIDDFFELSDEAQFDRIDNMLEKEDFLSRGDFDYAERFLKDRIAADSADARSHRALAALYEHRAQGYKRKAAAQAKRSLELEPRVKEGHSILSYAADGSCWDWCAGNHRELIDYYYGFTRKNPDYRQGYLWLMDNLIADGRLDEAQQAVRDMEKVEYTYHVPLYDGWVAAARGDMNRAEALWQRMIDENPDSWIVWSCRGDAYVKQCRYDEAVACFEKAAELEQAPRYIDNWDSIGQIREIQGRWADAARAYEKVLELYREDWGATEGVAVEKYKAAILNCRART